ncbi:MAG: methyltransferase domain-containing protein [Candidatus Electrothrix sp. AR4]|nr:methyltransferase domain-containing protein [Candidatus Electrothrix sp. AR4]
MKKERQKCKKNVQWGLRIELIPNPIIPKGKQRPRVALLVCLLLGFYKTETRVTPIDFFFNLPPVGKPPNMLRPPYTEYNRLHVYYLDQCDLPPVDDPDLIGVWIEDDTAILFFHRPKEELIRRLCRDTGSAVVYQADLDYQDWEAGVKITSFSTKTLLVRPVWEPQNNREQGRTEILLDPGVIFGSGFHATTRLCLETLELLLLESGMRINSVLDLGTGTGLLAVAAAKLGVKRVTALDNNPLAVEVARRNVARNNCADVVDVRQFDLMRELPDMHYDLVITNLYKGLLIRLFTDSGFWDTRLYMVSGFIPGMEADLLAALPADRIQMLHRGNSEQWRLWLLQYSEENQSGQDIAEKMPGGDPR